jgi:branched-subunit amino acid aminotransferase/4-amino-4-deoxychorismate lyase
MGRPGGLRAEAGGFLQILRKDLSILSQHLAEFKRSLRRFCISIDQREQEFMALGSLRMASLASRRNITSIAGIRRILPFSVTATFCRMIS